MTFSIVNILTRPKKKYSNVPLMGAPKLSTKRGFSKRISGSTQATALTNATWAGVKNPIQPKVFSSNIKKSNTQKFLNRIKNNRNKN